MNYLLIKYPLVMKILINGSELEGLHPLKKCLPVQLNKMKLISVVKNKLIKDFTLHPIWDDFSFNSKMEENNSLQANMG